MTTSKLWLSVIIMLIAVSQALPFLDKNPFGTDSEFRLKRQMTGKKPLPSEMLPRDVYEKKYNLLLEEFYALHPQYLKKWYAASTEAERKDITTYYNEASETKRREVEVLNSLCCTN